MIQSLVAEEGRKVGVREMEEVAEEETKRQGAPAGRAAKEETGAPEDREEVEETLGTVSTRRILPAVTFLARPAKIIRHFP